MTTEDVKFRLTLDAGAFERGIGETRARAMSLDGALTRVHGGLEQLDQRGSKAATTLGALGGVMGSVGGQAGQAAGALADVSMLLAEGGPIGIGIAATAAASVALYTAFQEMKTAAREASRQLGDDLNKQLNESRGRLIDLDRAIRDFGKSAERITVEQAEREAKRAEGAVTAVNLLISRRAQSIRIRDEMDPVRQAAEEEMPDLLRQAEQARRIRDVALQRAASARRIEDLTTWRSERDQAKREAEDAEREAKSARERWQHEEQRRSEQADQRFTSRTLQARILDLMRAQAQEERAEQAASDARRQREIDDVAFFRDLHEQAREIELKEAEDHQRALIEAEKTAAAERERIAEERRRNAEQTATAATSFAVAAASDLTDALIAGDERALEHWTARTLKQAGVALVGHGVNALAGGIAEVALGNPAGAAAIGVGSGLIAGGLALGAGGTGIERAVGVVPGAEEPARRASSDRGVNAALPRRTSSRGRDSGAGGGITIIYGVGGPRPEDTARAIEDVMRGRR